MDWARTNGFEVHLVYGVLSGRSRASRGASHRIAVALGLKPKSGVSRAKVGSHQGAESGGAA
jgi:gp16 family phage-associated protein